jgi:hypothetical protein
MATMRPTAHAKIYMNCLPVKYLVYRTIRGITHGLRKIGKISRTTQKKARQPIQNITGAQLL